MAPGQQPFGSDRLVKAYDRMLERIHDFWDRNGGGTLHERIDRARETAVELNELTREEAERVGEYLRRDLEETARFIDETGQDFRDWFRFDLKLVESQFLSMLEGMVDQTRVELDRLADRARGIEEFRTGEVAGIGDLHCADCGAEMHFTRTGRIPPCPKCHGTVFRRYPPDLEETADELGPIEEKD